MQTVKLLLVLMGFLYPPQFVFIEGQLPSIQNPAGNHSVALLTDSLAVQQLMNAMDPSLDIK